MALLGEGQPVSDFTKLLHNLGPGAKILDIGCGTGEMTRVIAGEVPHAMVLGIDRDLRAVTQALWNSRAELLPNVRFRQAELLELNLPEAPFDLAVSRACLHYLPHPGDAFAPIARNLKSGGRMQVSCLGFGNAARLNKVLRAVMTRPIWQPYFVGFQHRWRYVAPRDCDAALQAAGFHRYSATLMPQTIEFPDGDAFVDWFTSNWRPYIDRIPALEQNRFVKEFVATYCVREKQGFRADLVWLCIDGVRR